ncbi:hypothetical protein WHZ78_18915 [Bradyrhizobium symbiodeficiens]|uniref:hypothetical protein n=1 Tax=Bradyrhizobium symbiodeficiens TaxID=1404367 RepID=UPI0030D4A187
MSTRNIVTSVEQLPQQRAAAASHWRALRKRKGPNPDGPGGGLRAHNLHPWDSNGQCRVGPFVPAVSPVWNVPHSSSLATRKIEEDGLMDGLIYLVGLIVVIMAVLSFFGLR